MEELSLLIDIQSGLVRAGLVQKKSDKSLHILHVVNCSIPRKMHTNGAYITKTMLKALSIVANTIVTDGVKNIDSIHYVLSSPWVLSHSKKVKVAFDKDTEISKKMVYDIVNAEQDKLESRFKEGNFNKELESDSFFIEKKIFEIKLNGYVVNNYEGRRAKEIEISFASSLTSKKILEKIHSTVEKNIQVPKVHYHSALLSQFIALQSLFKTKEDYVSIHVHNELTDLVIVKNGMCEDLASFPIGISTLLRKISHALKHSVETSDSLLKLIQNKNLDDSENQKIKKKIDPILHAWYLEFIKTMSQGVDSVLPRTIYLSAHEYFEIFKNILTANNQNNLDVSTFDQGLLESHVVFENKFEKSQSIGMYAIVIS